MRRADDATDLVAALYLLIDFGKDVSSRAVAGAIGFLEELAPALVKRLIGPEQSRRRDLFADCAGDAPGRDEEGIVLLAALRTEPTVEALTDSVDRAEQNAALAEDVRLVLEF